MITSKNKYTQTQSSIKRSLNFISTGFTLNQNVSTPLKGVKLTTARSVYLSTIDYVRNLSSFITSKFQTHKENNDIEILEESICIKKTVGMESNTAAYLDYLKLQE